MKYDVPQQRNKTVSKCASEKNREKLFCSAQHISTEKLKGLLLWVVYVKWLDNLYSYFRKNQKHDFSTWTDNNQFFCETDKNHLYSHNFHSIKFFMVTLWDAL